MKPIFSTNRARALAIHFKKTRDLDCHGKVDMTKSEIEKLRTQELVNKTTAIRDLGTDALAKFPLRLARGEGQGEVSSWILASAADFRKALASAYWPHLSSF